MKKILMIMTAGCLLLLPQTVLATEVGVYDSNGITSFFGVYEEPVNEPEGTVKEQPGDKQVNQKGNNILPATGADYFNSYQSTCLLILIAIKIILFIRRTKNEKNFSNDRYCIDEHYAASSNRKCS